MVIYCERTDPNIADFVAGIEKIASKYNLHVKIWYTEYHIYKNYLFIPKTVIEIMDGDIYVKDKQYFNIAKEIESYITAFKTNLHLNNVPRPSMPCATGELLSTMR